MRKVSKIFLTMLLACTVTSVYAIEVSVVSTNENIEGLGFTANGKKHGGPGSSYHAKKLPKGSYTFGIRANGKDIGCSINGKKSVKLSANTNVSLSFDGKHYCVASLNS